MILYPVFLKLKHKSCLVIGGGEIATRKVENLLVSGALVKIVSPDLTGRLEQLVRDNKVKYLKRKYKTGDLDGMFLVVAATNDSKSNISVYEEASSMNILVNSVDDKENCNFYVPSIFRRGALQLAISTSGKVPAMAKRIRKWFEKIFPPSLEQDIIRLADIRNRIVERFIDDSESKKQAFANELGPEMEKVIGKIKAK